MPRADADEILVRRTGRGALARTSARLLALVLLAAAARAEEPSVRVRIEPGGDVWVGQVLTLRVTVRSEPPPVEVRLDLPKPRGCVLLGPEGEPRDGSREVAVVPRRAGEHVIPPFPVEAVIEGEDGERRVLALTTEEVRFTAKLPPGAEGVTTLVTARKVTLAESWEPDTASLEVGARITRRLVLEAAGLPGRALPPVPHPEVIGVDVHRAPPVFGDEPGRRTDEVTYVCRRPGLIDLPALTLVWWNPAEERLERVKLPGRTMAVARAPEVVDEEPPHAERGSWWIFVLAVLAALGLVGYRLRATIGRRLAGWREARERSEPAVFERLRRACTRNEPVRAYETLETWIVLRQTGPAPPGLARFLREHGDPDLEREMERLKRAVLEKDRAWRGARLAQALVRIRKKGRVSR